VRIEVAGVSRARNAGTAAATKPIIAFTDDDCLPDPGWTKAIERAFTEDPAIGFLTGRIVADRQRRLHLSTMISDERRPLVRGVDLDTVGSGANMALRRKSFEAIGGFDEALGPGAKLGVAEDRDLFWRLLLSGEIGRYEPDAIVTHVQWRRERAAIYRMYEYGVGRGALLSKMRRMDPDRRPAMLREDLWSSGIRSAMRNLRIGYQSGAIADLAKAAGMVVGNVRARRWRIQDGHFRA
jgi:GT2 family glycosyltransferase